MPGGMWLRWEWAYFSQAEKGGGEKPKKYCEKYRRAATNTHIMPKNHNKRRLIKWQGSGGQKTDGLHYD